ncbi:plant self-incompatibility S1 [Artemisia annua]|uniref:S-protein homolog n=1 Tax=Artemisia annua TaxID=35608 RepID=A0A2U1QIS8_ARTAN|nr:plant self-incompatibility S1 [Artemisia annua]
MNLFIRALFIFATIPLCVASSPNDLCFFRMYITNGIEDKIAVHVSKRGGEDLGNRTLAFNEEFDWKFGVVLFRTYYRGEFWWGSHYKTTSIFNRYVFGNCFNGNIFAVQRCYWLVKPDGIYLSDNNGTFPDDWNQVERW